MANVEDLTAEELIEKVGRMRRDTVERYLAEEQEGKQRQTVLTALQERMTQLEEQPIKVEGRNYQLAPDTEYCGGHPDGTEVRFTTEGDGSYSSNDPREQWLIETQLHVSEEE